MLRTHHATPRSSKRPASRAWPLTALLTGAVLLSAACAGTGSPSAGATPQNTSGPVARVATTASATAQPKSASPRAVATPHPNTPDPCGLVTLDEAETALGVRPFPASARPSTDSAEVRCTYESISGGQVRSVIVAVWKGSEARPVYDLRHSTYGQGGGVTEVAGLGERAFVVKGTDNWVNVMKGDVYLSVEVESQTLSATELQTRVMSLARLAVSRL